MKLADWRKKKNISQEALADKLEAYAAQAFPDAPRKKLSQRTLSSWENGVMPRKFWLKAVESFTGNKVRANDFAQDQDALA